MHPSKVKIKALKINNSRIKLGEAIVGRLALRAPTSKVPSKVVVDYFIYFFRKNGSHREKAFKGKNLTAAPGSARIIKIPFKLPLRKIATRIYHHGTQYLAAKLDGVLGDRVAFKLLEVGPLKPGD